MTKPARLARWFLFLVVPGLFIQPVRAQSPAQRFTGPWKVDVLKAAPRATWGSTAGLVQEVYYEGEPLNGKPTRVFAYYARPKTGDGPFPAMVLVHGGGGTAFAEWAKLWAERGYAALAMDLSGCGTGRARLADGGPDQGDEGKFRDFSDADVNQMWTYHAVAAVLRGHSLLASRKEVDAARIGVTGISWGGYLTCIVTGIDDRLKVAVPVYGCGFLHEDSCWLPRFAAMKPEQRDRWIGNFDPSKYLAGVRCPILFINGTNDFAYPLDSYQKSYRLVPGRVDLCITIRMPHGHPQGWAPREIGLFVDSVLKGGDPLAKLGSMKVLQGKATAPFQTKTPAVKAQLHYTLDTGTWQERRWQTVEATLDGATVSAELPKERPLTCFLTLTDSRGAVVSTDHATLAE
jgi:dienelactone hydrolase